MLARIAAAVPETTLFQGESCCPPMASQNYLSDITYRTSSLSCPSYLYFIFAKVERRNRTERTENINGRTGATHATFRIHITSLAPELLFRTLSTSSSRKVGVSPVKMSALPSSNGEGTFLSISEPIAHDVGDGRLKIPVLGVSGFLFVSAPRIP